jgi:hypothetical protein
MKISLPFWFCVFLLILIQQPLKAQDWQLTGNSGTSASTNFLGTIDNKALVLRTDNIQRLRITASGNVGIGTTSPVQKLDVNGNINMAYGYSLYTANQRVFTMDIGVSPIRGNLFAGASSGISNTTGIHNTASGYSALRNNTTGENNTASGYEALYSNLEGPRNTAAGSYALYKNTDGFDNAALGYQALYSNTEGFYNTASGNLALYSNTSGDYNNAFGYKALYLNTSGVNNTAFGHWALYSNTNEYANTAFGFHALRTSTGAGGNTAIGAFADAAYTNLTNATAIGYSARVDASNKVLVGNFDVTKIGGQVGWTTFSDGRFKKNIKADVRGLTFINSLRPITYTVDINSLNAYYDKGGKHDSAYENAKASMQQSANEASKIVYTGFVAQEVEAAAKKLNYDFSGVDKPQSKDGLYGLRYAEFVVPLVKAVQELSKQNDELGIMNDELKKTAEQQQTHIHDLESRLAKLESLMNGNQATISDHSSVIYQRGTMNEKPETAKLEQNIPNPFNNTTTINYTLGQQYASAKIIVADKSGKVLKDINVSGTRKGSLEIGVSTLSSGAYQYSLYVDGKLIDTTQMILAR